MAHVTVIKTTFALTITKFLPCFDSELMFWSQSDTTHWSLSFRVSSQINKSTRVNDIIVLVLRHKLEPTAVVMIVATLLSFTWVTCLHIHMVKYSHTPPKI